MNSKITWHSRVVQMGNTPVCAEESKCQTCAPRAKIVLEFVAESLVPDLGRVGTPKSRFIGACPGDMENVNGSEMRRVLEERNLHAVATFTPTYLPTWWSGREQHRGRRIDHVLVRGGWREDSEQPTTLLAIQLPDRPSACQSVLVVATFLVQWQKIRIEYERHSCSGSVAAVPPSVSEHRNQLPSRRNLGRVNGLLQ